MNVKNLNSLRLVLSLPVMIMLICACGGKGNEKPKFPANFNSIGDAGRVNYMMGQVSPDSLACFIIHAALGDVSGTKIDTLAIATNAAYEKFAGEDAVSFANAYDSLYNHLALPQKAKVLIMAGSEDLQGLGYRLGLEYLADIRDKNKTLQDVKSELRELEKACGNDTATFQRFKIGLKTALEVDSGRDVSREIYNEYTKAE